MKLRLAQAKEIPALCPNCGYVFNSHTGFFEYPVEIINGKCYEVIEGNDLTVKGMGGTITCRNCNYEKAEFRTDLFEFVKETFNDLKKLGLPEIVYLENLFKKLADNPTEENFVKAKEEAESTIKELKIFEIFSKYIKHPITSNTLSLISLIVAILTYLQGCIGSKEEPKVISVYNITLSQNIKEIDSKIYDSNSLKTISKEIKIGRNDPCSCNSGKKFKNCCGKN